MIKKVTETFLLHYPFLKTFRPNASLTGIKQEDLITIESVHREYCNSYSDDIFSISNRASVAIYNLICFCKPPVILDLGSGFTTWLSYYAARNSGNTAIISVDSSNTWIARNKEFLRKQNVDSAIINYETFKECPPDLPYGSFIINDIGDPDNFSLRESSLSLLTDYVKNGAVLFLDDIHKPSVKNAALKFIRENNFRFQDLCTATFDHFGRYSWLIFAEQNES